MSSGRRPTTRARSGPQASEDAAASLGPNQTSQGPSENNNGGTSATVSTTGSGPPQWFTAAISGLRSEIAETRSDASQAVEATASLTTTVSQLKKKKTVDRPAPAVLKKPDLARQHAFNERVLTSVDAALESLPDDAEEVRSILLQSKSDLDTRQKHIRIADKFDWETVEVYTDGLVGDNCEDDRRIASAASLARRLARGSQDDPPAVSQHHRSLRNFASPPVHRHTSSATPLPDPRCYLCGETGYFARQCHLLWSSQLRQRDRLASSASPWPSRNQWRPSTPAPPPSASSPMAAREDSVQPPYGRSPRRLRSKISVECGHDVAGGVRVKWIEPDPIDDNSLSSFDCPYPDSPPKGDSFSDALVLALPFWLEIGANKFVLSVISEGYFLPFVSLPDCLLLIISLLQLNPS